MNPVRLVLLSRSRSPCCSVELTPMAWTMTGTATADSRPDGGEAPGPHPEGEPVAGRRLDPQPGSAAPVASNRLRRRRLLPGMAARVWWVGVHGGAGETTL